MHKLPLLKLCTQNETILEAEFLPKAKRGNGDMKPIYIQFFFIICKNCKKHLNQLREFEKTRIFLDPGL